MSVWWAWREGDDVIVWRRPTLWAYDEDTDTWVDLDDPDIIWW